MFAYISIYEKEMETDLDLLHSNENKDYLAM